MVPERISSKRRIRLLAVTDEAACGMSVEGEEERDEEMVGIPKGFVRLLSYFDVGGGEHQEHTEEHDMPSDATGLCVMNLNRALRSYLVPFNIEEAYLCQQSP